MALDQANGSTSIRVTTASGEVLDLGQISGAIVGAHIETQDLNFGRSNLKKRLRRFLFYFEGTFDATSVEFVIKLRNNLTDPLISYGPFPISDSGQPIKVNLPASNFARIRFQDNAINSNWRLSKIEVYGSPGGKRF